MLMWSGDSVDITPTGDGGVRKIILKKSNDKNGFLPLHRDVIKVHYKGFFEDGTCFTKSVDNQEARTFVLGRGEVLKGWEVAVATMKLHEVSIFKLLPEYAYGDLGLPPTIAPSTTVFFELELLSIEGEYVTKDGSVSRSIIVHSGFGTKSPMDNDLCTVSYSTQLFSDPSVVMESVENITFVLGEGFEVGVPFGIEKALKKMRKGERSRLKVRCGSGLKGHEKLGVPALSDLIHYVELHDFQETRKHWEMSREELLHNALAERESALQYFKAEKYQMASRRFSRCLLYAESINFTSSELQELESNESSEPEKDTIETEQSLEETGISSRKESTSNSTSVENEDPQVMHEKKQELVLTSLLNLSLCDQKIGKNLKALDYASRVLEIDQTNVKALYRKAMIFYRLKSFDEARRFFRQVLEQKPDMKVVQKYLDLCNLKLKDQSFQSKVVFRGMFDKFAKEDAQKENGNGSKDIFTDVGEWDNKMAEGMMTLEQEMAAFGETMPEKGYDKENDNPGSDDD